MGEVLGVVPYSESSLPRVTTRGLFEIKGVTGN